MKLLSIMAGLAWTALNIMPAAAADPVRFALCYDLSKAYTFVTPRSRKPLAITLTCSI
jgi:branched-chain amino acid transport system substrate-binding protein